MYFSLKWIIKYNLVLSIFVEKQKQTVVLPFISNIFAINANHHTRTWNSAVYRSTNRQNNVSDKPEPAQLGVHQTLLTTSKALKYNTFRHFNYLSEAPNNLLD